MSHIDDLFQFSKSNFTNLIHKDVYPTIDPTSSLLTQAGKTILITGSGNNLGLAIASAFVAASAAAVIITGRRTDVLDQAREQLESQVQASGGRTKIVAKACDITNRGEVDALWEEVTQTLNMTIHVLVSCAARPPAPKSLLETGSDEVWAQMETNVMGPLYMTEKLCSQPDKVQKFIVNISVASIHYYTHPAAAARPSGTFSRMASTTLFQLVAMEKPHDQVQVVSVHPGLLWNEYFASLGLSQADFDSRELAAAFCVWASTKAAAFLHGRFVWASWDVEELAHGDIRRELDDDPYFLRVGVPPLQGGSRK